VAELMDGADLAENAALPGIGQEAHATPGQPVMESEPGAPDQPPRPRRLGAAGISVNVWAS
jgi:hypothetical protein